MRVAKNAVGLEAVDPGGVVSADAGVVFADRSWFGYGFFGGVAIGGIAGVMICSVSCLDL